MEYQVIHGDSRAAIPAEAYELVITSPPYNVGKDYDGHEDTLGHLSSKGFTGFEGVSEGADTERAGRGPKP